MTFSESYIKNLIQDQYQLEVSCKLLNGYDELNFLLSDKNNNQYVLKLTTTYHNLAFLEAQIAILQHLEKSSIANKFQKIISTKAGKTIGTITIEGCEYYFRLLTYLPGVFWVNQSEKKTDLYYNLGDFLAEMDLSMASFYHPACFRHYEWDLKHTLEARNNVSCIIDHEKQRIASYFLLQFETEVTPNLPYLRTATIHNDANDYNLLANSQEITGLIDFGDTVHTQLIHNLAIACTYAMLNTNNPIMVATNVVKGYHNKLALTELELSLLYYLIAGRLCISVCQSAYNYSQNSTNEHHYITEKYAWDLLFQLIQINPLYAHNQFRLACNYSSIINNTDHHQELISKRNKYIGNNLSISYNEKAKIIKGALQYLYDDQGNTYIDCVNNVSHVGHCHPTVVKAMQKQIATLNTNTRYLSDPLVDFAEELIKTLPENLKICYFTNSGSEANDLAIRMSRHFTNQKDVIVLDHAYHGTSTVAIEMSPYKFDGKGGFGKMPYIHKAENPDQYRGAYRYNDANAGQKYAQDVARICQTLKTENKKPAAFICETLLGVGGQMALPKDYLKEVYQTIREFGGVCIADEVQVGFGRVGEKFWGFELQEVTPDIVVLGKPIGNGHPLAAVITTQEIADAFNNGMEYFNTFAGNPVSMVTGKTVLKVIQDEELQKNALEVGNHLLAELNKLKDKHPIIGDVRGHGLFIGVEMVKDRKTLEPAIPEIDIVVEEMKKRGFFISTDGPLYNVLKIKPPIIFSIQNANQLVYHLDQVFDLLSNK